MVCLAPRALRDCAPSAPLGASVRPLNFTVRPQDCYVAAPIVKTALLVTAPVLLLITSTVLCLYYAERLLAPEQTSQEYKRLRSGEIQIPSIIIIPSNVGTEPDVDRYLEDSRRQYLSNALERERRLGRHGLITWGSLAIFGALVLWIALRIRRNAPSLRSNNRWSGP